MRSVCRALVPGQRPQTAHEAVLGGAQHHTLAADPTLLLRVPFRSIAPGDGLDIAENTGVMVPVQQPYLISDRLDPH